AARPEMLRIDRAAHLECAHMLLADVVLWAALWWSWMAHQVSQSTPRSAGPNLVVWGTCSVGCSSRGFEQIEHLDDASLDPLTTHMASDFTGTILILHARGRGPKAPDRKMAAEKLPNATFMVRAIDDILDIADAVRQAVTSIEPHLERPLADTLDLPLRPGRLQPTDDLTRWLQRASHLAEDARQGFVGVEHLALAAIELPWGEHLRDIMATLSPAQQPLQEGLSQLEGSTRAPVRATRRVRRWIASLDGDCSALDLWRSIADDPAHHLHELCERDLGSILAKPPAHAPEPTAERWYLEVVGGPQDGLRLPMVEGMVVGRGKQSTVCLHALYHHGALTDPYLSRRALTWIDGGDAQVAGEIQRLRRGYRDTRFGRITVLPGDLIYLTDATRLRAVGPPVPRGRWGD
ncbi:MAG: hypothetical protein ACI9MC_002816, partial [Kiritimatiellia bacterium]